jgi:drug/metabolite transporter (DMT)-like permease
MNYELFALVAAIGWAGNAVLVRMGARYSGVSPAVLLSFLVACCFFWAISWWYFPAGFLRSPASLYFVLGGLIQPAVVRFLHYTGIARLGVSRAEPLRSITPLFASFIAMLFLRERPGLVVYSAIILSIAGVSLISYRREGEAHWRTFDLIFPLAGAVLAAVSQNIRKAGLLILPAPLVAAAITTTTSLVVFLFTMSASGNVRALKIRRPSLPFYGAATVVALLAQICGFTALSHGEVSVVVTLTSTSPLFTVAFSGIFLRDIEKVNLQVVVGTLFLVGAIVLILNR